MISRSLTQIIFGFVTACLFLAGCNLPRANSTPTADAQVATIVAQTLEAVPTHTPTVLLPSSTPAAQPTQTTQSSPTATPIPGDPALSLGNPTAKDTLENGKGFGIGDDGYDDGQVKIFMNNGMLMFQSAGTGGWRSWRVRPPSLTDFYLEGKFQINSCSGNDAYGLVIRTPDYESGKGYYYGLTCDAKVFFSSANGNETPTSLLPPTQLPPEVLAAGANQTLRMGILAKGESYKLFINGKEIQTITDGSSKSGYFGMFTAGFSGGLSVGLDELAYWNNIP